MSVELRHISFEYREGIPVLQDVSVIFKEGELSVIVGPSGCGKTTLLKIAAGLLESGSYNKLWGETYLFGKTIEEFRKKEPLGYVFQDYLLLPFMNVLKNVTWPWFYSTEVLQRSDKLVQQGKEILDTVGLLEVENRLPHELSGGMKARVALARALLLSPRVIFIDEVLSPLDVGWRIDISQKLRKICDDFKTTIIVVSHDIEGILDVSDRIIVIGNDGSLKLDVANQCPDYKQRTYSIVRKALLDNHPSRAFSQ